MLRRVRSLEWFALRVPVTTFYLLAQAYEAIRASADVTWHPSYLPDTSDHQEPARSLERGRWACPMASAQAERKRAVLLAGLLICISHLGAASSDASTEVALEQDTAFETEDVGDCDTVVDAFLAKRSKMPKLTPESHNHMLYFLHIPRTAGRTYHACFLKCGLPTACNTSIMCH